jgi:hypothetical protein
MAFNKLKGNINMAYTDIDKSTNILIQFFILVMELHNL